MYTPDLLRYVAFGLIVVCMAFFPLVAYVQGRRPSAWLAITSQEISWLVILFALFEHLGEPLVWYRTPLLLVAGVLMFAFFMVVNFERRNPPTLERRGS